MGIVRNPIRVALAFVATLALAVLVMVSPSSAAEAQWRYGVGTSQVDNEFGRLTRSVEVWVAPDGRYRAETRNTNGSPSAETVVYDGVQQWAFITDGAGILKVAKGVSPSHFAISDDLWTLKSTGSSINVGGVLVTVQIDWVNISPDPTRFEIESMIAAATKIDVQPTSAKGVAIEASGGVRTATFNNCVSAWNNVNSENGYFRGASTALGNCKYMDVTNFGRSGVNGVGGCYWGAWLGTSPIIPWYTTVLVFTGYTGLCSLHSGWLSNWTQIVSDRGLMAAY